MTDILTTYNSIAPAWAAAAMNNYLGLPPQGISAAPVLSPITEVKDYQTYNAILLYLYQQLQLGFAKTQELEGQAIKADRLTSENLTSIRQAIEALEGKISFVVGTAPIRETHTDTAYETFNGQSIIAQDASLYAGGTIPLAYVDPLDNKAKLPPVGIVSATLPNGDGAPPRCELDRVLGVAINTENTVAKAFNGKISSFWEDTIVANAPIYADVNTYPWLPATYKGGAACRLRVDLAGPMRISEVAIRPFGEHPMRFLGFSYVGSNSLIQDPTFTTYGVGSFWSFDSTSYGATGTATVSVSSGVATLSTATATGACYLQSAAASGVAYDSVDVNLKLKTYGNTPVSICILSYNASGVALDESTRHITLDGDGWTEVKLNFDLPSGTGQLALRVGLPVNFERMATLEMSAPAVYPIYRTDFDEALDSYKVIPLGSSIVTDVVFLTFSQEHGKLSNITRPKASEFGLSTTKQSNKPDTLLEWSDYRRKSSDGWAEVRPLSMESAPYILGSMSSSLVAALADFSPTPQQSLAYAYTMGAYELDLRYTDYAARARYVSAPIEVDGEIREFRVLANDTSYSPKDLTYRVTLRSTDSPETGKIVYNSKLSPDAGTLATGTETLPRELTYTGDWAHSSDSFQPTTMPTFLNTSDPYLIEYFSSVEWFRIDRTVSVNNQVSLNIAAEDLSNDSGVILEYYLLHHPTAPTASRDLQASFSVSLVEDETVAASTTFLTYPRDMLVGSGQYSFNSALISLSDVDPANRDSITRWVITFSGGNLSALETGQYLYLAIRRARTTGAVKGSRLIRFIPLEETLSLEALATDFLVPTRDQVEVIRGTDREGRVVLKNYPYVNQERVKSLSASMSANTGGRLVPYDPNAVLVKTKSGSNVVTITGYRPLAVTLNFTTQNLIAVPDSLGKPKPGDITYSGDEILEIAALSQKTITVTKEVDDSDYFDSFDRGWGDLLKKSKTTKQPDFGAKPTTSKKTRTVTTEIAVLYYNTAHKNLVSSVYGTPIKVWWYNPDPITPTSQAIDSSKIIVDTASGLIQIMESAPAGFTQVKCNYWYSMGEDSLREYFKFSDVSVTSGTNQLTVQTYPITRNMTDYMTGEIPVLRPPILDSGDPNYYPVFEYYVHHKGYLVFAVNMHLYSDTPAEITVNYSTLGISPRLIIDMENTDYSERPYNTPTVDDYTLLMNVRR